MGSKRHRNKNVTQNNSSRSDSREKRDNVELDVQLHILANQEPPMATEMLKMFYNASFQNQIGLMFAKNSETDKVEGLLVGLAVDGDDFNCFPLAKVLTSDEAAIYLAPDRQGGWQSMIEGESEVVIKDE